MPTGRQIGRLYSLGHALGMDHDTVKQELQVLYGLSSSKDLSPIQYEEYTTHLQRQINAAATDRQLPPDEAEPRYGMYASAAHLAEFANSVQTFGRAWAGQMADEDVVLLSILLDKFRLYRVRDRKLSQKQVDDFVDAAAKFPLWVFRAAGEIYLGHYTHKPEKYFLGIMKNVIRDRQREAAARQGDLALT
jgi:hypothetical protein